MVVSERAGASESVLRNLEDFANHARFVDDDAGRASVRAFYPVMDRPEIADSGPVRFETDDDAWLAGCAAYALEQAVDGELAVRAFRAVWKPPLCAHLSAGSSYFESDLVGVLKPLPKAGHDELGRAARLIALKTGCAEDVAMLWIVTGCVSSPQPPRHSFTVKPVRRLSTRRATMIGVMRLVLRVSKTRHPGLDFKRTEKALWRTVGNLAARSAYKPAADEQSGERAIALLNRALTMDPGTRGLLRLLVHPTRRIRSRVCPPVSR